MAILQSIFLESVDKITTFVNKIMDPPIKNTRFEENDSAIQPLTKTLIGANIVEINLDVPITFPNISAGT